MTVAAHCNFPVTKVPTPAPQEGDDMTNATISVRGTATIRAKPDELLLAFEIDALQPSPLTASQEVADRSRTLDQLLDELGIRPESRQTQGVTVREKREWVENKGSVHRGYRASHRVQVRLGDPTVAPVLMSEAIHRAKSHIGGPWWHVSPDNPARIEACANAATAGRAKAKAYADALGMKLGSIMAISEAEVSDRVRHEYIVMGEPASFYGDAPDVQPGEIEVSATVDLVFEVGEK
jgi:uncharacterized protein YggE